MSRLTIAVLVLLVAGLGFLAWRQTRSTDQPGVDVPLFPHLQAARVVKVHMENLERDESRTFEREKDGRWMMTDPIRVRAEGTIVQQLVDSAIARQGTPVNPSEIDMKKLGLDPPHFVLVLFDEAGTRAQVDVGSVDPDQSRVNVFAHGQVLRAVRDFQVLLDLMPEEYQSHVATAVDVRDVIELHRRGSVYEPGAKEKTDLTLDALLDEGQWRATAPVAGLLDPTAMSLVLGNTAGLHFEHYADNGDAALSVLGLDPPDMTFELGLLHGDPLKMVFGSKHSPLTDWWNGKVVGEKEVWSIPGEQALALAVPITDLLDHRLHRFKLADIDAVQLSTAAREVRLENGIFGWTVAEAHAGSRVFGPKLPADAKKVNELLSTLDHVEIRTFALAAQLGDDEGHDAIHIRANSASAGGVFGGPGENGGVHFQRDNETAVGVVDDAVRDLARTPPSAFWGNSIVEIPEVDAQMLSLRRGTDEAVFVRDRHGVWVRRGRDDQARELQPVLDPLVFLRSTAHLESASEPLKEPIEVHWTLTVAKKDLVIGILEKDGARQVVCDFEGRRSVLQRQDLHALLNGLFQVAR